MKLIQIFQLITSLLILSLFMSCNSGESEREKQLREIYEKKEAQKRDWERRMIEMDCPNSPQDSLAIKAILRAYKKDKSQYVFGPKDPYKRKNDIINRIRTRPNPKGEGIIITASKDINIKGSADFARKRSVWLYIDKKIYPLNVDAATTLGKLKDKIPDPILKRAGLIYSPVPDKFLAQIGIEEYSLDRRFNGINPFPK